MIRTQISALEGILIRLEEKNHRLFEQVVTSLKRGRESRASIVASELVELRKMTKMVIQAKLALEQIELRLSTVTEMGDVVTTLGPAVSAVKNVKEHVALVVPQAEESFSELASILGDILIDAGQQGGYTLNFKAASEDAARILDEASTVAERMLKERFPEIPSDLTIPLSRQAELT